jgi:hypothetical protein
VLGSKSKYICVHADVLKSSKKTSEYIIWVFQAERVSDAGWGCDWVGTPVPFQRCLFFIIAAAKKEFRLTAGKFVPVCNSTMMNVRLLKMQHNKKKRNIK